MGRFLARSFVPALLVCCATSLSAQSPELVHTKCYESDVRLDATHTSSRLGRCSDDAPVDLLWHLDRIDQVAGSLDGRFIRRSRGTGVVVYVMDTGVFADHDEFEGDDHHSRVIAGYDAAESVVLGASTCTSNNKATAPCFGNFDELGASSHGTGVASLIAGRNIGVAPDAKIVSVRVMNEHGLATTRTYLEGLNDIIHHAWTSNASQYTTSVVNISGWVLDHITATTDDNVVPYATVEQKMRDMIGGVDANGNRDPNGKKFLFVVASNNTDGGCGPSGIVDRFPAAIGKNIEGMITVGGMTEDNEAWTGSCRGGVEVLAPAEQIFSATITARDHYRGRGQRNGTSFAAPIISGIAALLISSHPDLAPEQLEWWITNTPSRVTDPTYALAAGKVGYEFVPQPAVHAVASRASLAR
ncbi:MAG TPA: S8 family serine peptidase [Thermoanaerobaculia bacterium]|nr:S8 family serine peptidase [Thermoanaerobaculia bacterium]